MEIKIVSRHFDLAPDMRTFATTRAEKLLRYFDRIQQIELVIEKVKNNFQTECMTDVEHHDLFVSSSEHVDLRTCIDQSLNRTERQLRHYKSRLRDDKHHSQGR